MFLIKYTMQWQWWGLNVLPLRLHWATVLPPMTAWYVEWVIPAMLISNASNKMQELIYEKT